MHNYRLENNPIWLLCARRLNHNGIQTKLDPSENSFSRVFNKGTFSFGSQLDDKSKAFVPYLNTISKLLNFCLFLHFKRKKFVSWFESYPSASGFKHCGYQDQTRTGRVLKEVAESIARTLDFSYCIFNGIVHEIHVLTCAWYLLNNSKRLSYS